MKQVDVTSGNSVPLIRLPFGPQHPALDLESIHFTFEVDGERVVSVKPRLGYMHRGIEKLAETRTYQQNIHLVERICGICSQAHAICFAQAVEEIAEINIPARARYLRTIIAELERIQNHFLWLGVAAHEIGFQTLFIPLHELFSQQKLQFLPFCHFIIAEALFHQIIGVKHPLGNG